MNVLEFRRRLMMRRKKTDWIPLQLNCYTDEQLIELYGDLFETYDNAPEKFGAGNVTQQNYIKVGAIAIDTNAVSTQIGGNSSKFVRVYEDGVLIATVYAWNTTITWQAGSKARHIVCYELCSTGNGSTVIQSQIVWIISKVSLNQSSTVLKQIHYHREGNMGYSASDGSIVRSPYGLNVPDAVLYYPERWDAGGNNVNIRTKQHPTIVLPKYGCSMSTSFIFNMPAQFKHLYARWELGEVPTISSRQSIWYGNTVPVAQRYFTLHIKRQANDTLTEQLIAEYQSKGWTTTNLPGMTIVADYDETIPDNPYL